MKSPPRRINTPIITRELIVNVLVSASITVVGTLYVFWTESQADGQVTSRDTTMTFTTFVFFDMFNALSCRSQHKSILEVGWFSNKAFLYSVGGALAGQFAVIYFAPLQRVFQTEALSFSVWPRTLASAPTCLATAPLRAHRYAFMAMHMDSNCMLAWVGLLDTRNPLPRMCP